MQCRSNYSESHWSTVLLYIRYILIGCLCQVIGVWMWCSSAHSKFSLVHSIRFNVLIGCFCQVIQHFAFSKYRKKTCLSKKWHS